MLKTKWLYRYCISVLAVFDVSEIPFIIALLVVSTFQMTLQYASIGKILEANKDSASLGETFPFVQSIFQRLKIAFRALVSRSFLTFLDSQFCENSTSKYLKNGTLLFRYNIMDAKYYSLCFLWKKT